MMSLLEWLTSLPRVHKAEPVRVAIGSQTYEGVKYVEYLYYEKGMDIVRRGERKDGEQYTREVVYLLGDLPREYKRTTRIAFRLPEDQRDWYLACYHDGRDAPNKPPFTPNFMLMPWDVDQAIDHYETINGKKPRTRIPVVFQEAAA